MEGLILECWLRNIGIICKKGSTSHQFAKDQTSWLLKFVHDIGISNFKGWTDPLQML